MGLGWVGERVQTVLCTHAPAIRTAIRFDGCTPHTGGMGRKVQSILCTHAVIPRMRRTLTISCACCGPWEKGEGISITRVQVLDDGGPASSTGSVLGAAAAGGSGRAGGCCKRWIVGMDEEEEEEDRARRTRVAGPTSCRGPRRRDMPVGCSVGGVGGVGLEKGWQRLGGVWGREVEGSPRACLLARRSESPGPVAAHKIWGRTHAAAQALAKPRNDAGQRPPLGVCVPGPFGGWRPLGRGHLRVQAVQS